MIKTTLMADAFPFGGQCTNGSAGNTAVWQKRPVRAAAAVARWPHTRA